MKIAFFSNYLTHHQTPFCEELQKFDDVELTFVALEPIEQERLAMGYKDMNMYPYVLRAYENEESYQKAVKLCKNADILIGGNITDNLLLKRAKTNKPMFVFSERMFKAGLIHAFSPRVIKRMLRTHTSFKHKKAFLLCAGAFTSADFARMGAYKNKAYKWGYFPEVKKYDVTALMDGKKPASILWVGRMLEWKHPECAISVAERLKKEGYKFILDIIGNGVLEEKIRSDIAEKGLEDCVKMHGAMSPEEVREYMERAGIFLFTSDRNEGWGAVLNESMNSGCAVVASHIIGAAPFMIKHGENGLIYKNGKTDDLYKGVKFLIDNPEKAREMGMASYNTCADEWCAENAAKRFYALSKALLAGGEAPNPFEYGVCSKAEFLKDDWFKNKN